VHAEQRSAPFEWIARPNRSLTSSGRSIWLLLIAATATMTAGAAAAIGAWPVLPFAGLEVFLMWAAFRVIASHDEDYEILRVIDHGFEWERRAGNKVKRLGGNAAWANVCVSRTRHRCQVQLHYAGKCVTIGALATDSSREQLLAQLEALFPSVTFGARR
jgi:uncharacterized membrane protein